MDHRLVAAAAAAAAPPPPEMAKLVALGFAVSCAPTVTTPLSSLPVHQRISLSRSESLADASVN
jgi:hypothetical protein